MDKKKLQVVTGIIAGIFLLSFAAVMVAVATTGVSTMEDLHKRELEVELQLSKSKAIRADLQIKLDAVEVDIIKFREERGVIVNQRNDLINSFSSAETPQTTEVIEKSDLDCIAYAVAIAETKDCTTGMGATKNNCHGLMEWPAWNNYQRTGRTFANKEESYEAFKELWSSKYGGYPTWGQAVVYTGNDNPGSWYRNMEITYKACIENK